MAIFTTTLVLILQQTTARQAFLNKQFTEQARLFGKVVLVQKWLSSANWLNLRSLPKNKNPAWFKNCFYSEFGANVFF